MPEIEKIIKAIDKFLEIYNQEITTPVEINPYLESQGLLKDSALRPGLPIRKILRKGLIPHAYQMGVYWKIPHSCMTSKNITPTYISKSPIKIKTIETNLAKGHKLIQIGEFITSIIKKKYNLNPSCFYEYKPEWLLSYPTIKIIENHSELSELYSELIENPLTLKDEISKLNDKKLEQRQSFDIWIGEPFNFAIEFDEKQHFNQYRKITLDYYDKIKIKFPIEFYKKLNNGIVIKPGNSGFTRLQSYDPLFPEMLVGENQDNRIRQRAFRDYLKDVLPIENGFNPTLRIPYHLTNKKITNFTESEIRNIEKYIEDNDLI